MKFAYLSAVLLAAWLMAGCTNHVTTPEPAPYVPLALPAIEESSMFAAANRKISFKVTKTIETNNLKTLFRKACDIVTNYDGMVKQHQSNFLEISLPVAKAEQALAEIDQLGKVTQSDFMAHNFTELMNSFDIRLADLTNQRIRLIKLWNQAGSIEDLMRIEREMGANSTDYARMMTNMRETYDKITNVSLTINMVQAEQEQK